MFSSSNESDIQFELHFLDCQPDSITRSLNDKSVMDHLYRAATNKILKFEKSYKRSESNRVTDIDQLSLLLSPILFTPKNMTRNVSIDITKNENPTISIPIIKSENRTQSTPSTDVKTQTEVLIPKAPPLPSSLDLAIKLQSQSQNTAIVSPDQETLWANIKNQNVADYFNQSLTPINHKNSIRLNESKTKTILDARKSYNLGAYICFRFIYLIIFNSARKTSIYTRIHRNN